MKKIVTLLCIALLAFTSASLSVLAAPTPKQVKNFGILEFNLKQTKSGEAYIKAFEAFAKKNWNNRTYLKDLKTKLEKLLVSGAVKSTNDKLVLSYLDAKIGMVLEYNLIPGYVSNNTNNSTNSNNTNNNSTNNNTSTGSTSNSGSGETIEKPTGDILSKELYSKLISGTYFEGASDASFSFFEYADLESSNSAKLHNDDIIVSMLGQYGMLMDYRLLNFPLSNHQNAQVISEIAECVGLQKGGGTYYNFINEIFIGQVYTKDFAISKAESLGADRNVLNKCLDDGVFKGLVQNQKYLGEAIFGVREVPTIVIRNNYSGKFVVLVGNKSLSDYQKALESLYR